MKSLTLVAYHTLRGRRKTLDATKTFTFNGLPPLLLLLDSCSLLQSGTTLTPDPVLLHVAVVIVSYKSGTLYTAYTRIGIVSEKFHRGAKLTSSLRFAAAKRPRMVTGSTYT